MAPGIPASYRDDHQPIPVPVLVSIRADTLFVEGAAVRRRAPVGTVDVRLVYDGSPSVLRFPDGAWCDVPDSRALAQAFGANGNGGTSQWQSAVPRAFIAVLAVFVLMMLALYHYGVPFVARVAAAQVPAGVTTPLEDSVIAALDGSTFQPTALPASRQRELNDAFARLVGHEAHARYRLLFRRSPDVGPNAMALPAGTIVLTDELVALARDDREILGVLAHEAGHVEHRHSVRLIVQSSAVALLIASLVGDVSSLLAVAPATLINAKYSRDFEREADAHAAEILSRNGIPPSVLADVLQRIESIATPTGNGQPVRSDGGSLLDYTSSHPATRERLEYLRARQ